MRETPPDTLLQPVRLLAMDVDGVLTDGGITWGAEPGGGLVELKTFNVKDGLGLTMAQTLGIRVAWITGRNSPIVRKRAEELGVHDLLQGSRDKYAILSELMERRGLGPEAVLYIGDDLNDLPAFDAAGVRVTVANAPVEVKARAHWITRAAGGHGAVREVAEGVLKAQGRWEEALEAFLSRLRQEQSRSSFSGQ